MNDTLVILLAGAIIFIGFFWFMMLLFNSIKTRRLRRKYSEYEDASLQGEQRRKAGSGEFAGKGAYGIATETSAVRTRGNIAKGSDESERRSILPSTASSPVRENSYRLRDPYRIKRY